MPLPTVATAEPASECFLVTADKLVEAVLRRYAALKPQTSAAAGEERVAIASVA